MTRVKASINSSQQGGAQQQPQQQQQGYYGPPQQQQAYGPPGGVPPEGAAGYDAAPHMSSTQRTCSELGITAIIVLTPRPTMQHPFLARRDQWKSSPIPD